MNQRIVILGAAGDAAVVASSIEGDSRWTILGVLDDRLDEGTDAHGMRVLGRLDDWRRFDHSVLFIAALHKVKQMPTRAVRIEELAIPIHRWATVIDRDARVSRMAKVGHGTYLGPNVVVQPGASIGAHVSARAGANVGHDAKVEDFCYLGPNATLCGGTVMEQGSHLGPNACVVDGQRLGQFAVVGVCSAVTKALPARGVYFGVPATKVGTIA